MSLVHPPLGSLANESAGECADPAAASNANIDAAETLLNLAMEVSSLSGAMTEMVGSSRESADRADTGHIVAETGNIMQMMAEIDLIARRTRIVAINAAIEAARVKESSGNSFGVVANEVKTLADQTFAVSKRVRTTLQRLGDLVEDSSSKMSQTTASVEDSNSKVKDIDEKLKGVVSAVRTLAQNARTVGGELEARATNAEDYSRQLNVAAVAVAG
jgi:methyl-accepting chemotaxis protein